VFSRLPKLGAAAAAVLNGPSNSLNDLRWRFFDDLGFRVAAQKGAVPGHSPPFAGGAPKLAMLH
jgi:hypothetical protein